MLIIILFVHTSFFSHAKMYIRTGFCRAWMATVGKPCGPLHINSGPSPKTLRTAPTHAR
jgi:hypothetical protein